MYVCDDDDDDRRGKKRQLYNLGGGGVEGKDWNLWEWKGFKIGENRSKEKECLLQYS